MNRLTTVFEITAGTNGIRPDLLLRLAIGVVFLIIGLVGLVFHKRTQERSSKKLYDPVFIFMTGWGVLWLSFHVSLWKTDTSDIDRLLDVYKNGGFEVIEGIVNVTHKQPAGGHTAGDRITIGDQEFEVDYYRSTPGYKQTISHGGALRDEVFARLCHYEGVILKVEVETNETGQRPSTSDVQNNENDRREKL